MTLCAFQDQWGCCPDEDSGCPFEHPDVVYDEEDDTYEATPELSAQPLAGLPSSTPPSPVLCPLQEEWGRCPDEDIDCPFNHVVRDSYTGTSYRGSSEVPWWIKYDNPHKPGPIPPDAMMPAPPRRKKRGTTHRQGRHLSISPESTTPLFDFFGFFRDFKYKPLNSATDEYYRLCDSKSWSYENPPADVRNCFESALIRQFRVCFGTDLEDLRAWQSLCEAIGFAEIPRTVRHGRMMVEGVYVNMIDLIDKMKSRRSKAHFTIQYFASARELAEYSRVTRKLFPPYNGGGLLVHLMRHWDHSQRRGAALRI